MFSWGIRRESTRSPGQLLSPSLAICVPWQMLATSLSSRLEVLPHELLTALSTWQTQTVAWRVVWRAPTKLKEQRLGFHLQTKQNQKPRVNSGTSLCHLFDFFFFFTGSGAMMSTKLCRPVKRMRNRITWNMLFKAGRACGLPRDL